MKNKTCGECRYMLHKDAFKVCTHSMTETSMFDEACKHFAPPTNGDLIRQMSNEELAELFDVCLRDVTECDCECVKGILDWLNAPAESEGDDE